MAVYQFETWDVFTPTRFQGNPLAVVFDCDPLSTDEMAMIAREFNLSETVFIRSAQDGAHRAALRIFTPSGELAFAGHPTIGAAHAIARRAGERSPFQLELQAGVFGIDFTNKGARFINPNPPITSPTDLSCDDIAPILGLSPSDLLAPPLIAGAPTPFLTVELTIDSLSRIQADMSAIARLCDEIYLVARHPARATHFHTRMFAPGIGIPEDPATGSAACALPAYIKASTGIMDGSHNWTVEQGVEMGRASLINVSFDVTEGVIGCVSVSGHATPVQSGEILV